MNVRSKVLCVLLLAFCVVYSASAQKTLEIEIEDDEVRTYTLDSSTPVLIAADGSIKAAATEAPICAAGCEDVKVSMLDADGGDFQINSDSEGPVDVPLNGTLTFEWASRGAWECEGLGLPGTDWDEQGKSPAGRQANVAVDALTEGQQYTARVRCSNGEGNRDEREIVVRIDEETEVVPDPDPDDRGPSQFTRAERCRVRSTANCFEYASIFGEPFPGGSQARNIFQSPDTYISMRIDTEGLDPTRSGRWAREASSDTESGTVLLTLSRHPGDFDKQRIAEEMGNNCYVMATALGTISWKGPDNTTAGRCVLNPDEVYYLNILYTSSENDGVDPEDLTWRCQDSTTATCGNLYSPR